MVIPHSSILRPRALWRRWLVPHALVPVRRLRHLPARGQLAPRQLAAARTQAATVEPAASAAQIPVLHRSSGYLTNKNICYCLFKTTRVNPPRRAGRVRLVSKHAEAHSSIIGWAASISNYADYRRYRERVIVFAGMEDRALAPVEIEW